MENLLRFFRSLIPKRLFRALQPVYHYLLAGLGTLVYRFPSRELYVVGVTGTKGKTSTTELIAAVLTRAGYRVALSNSIRMSIDGMELTKGGRQSMPGRFALQKFFRRAVSAGCAYAVVEMTSEGAKQFRHIGTDLDALIFTNLSPEHIEAHGSYENYRAAKLKLAHQLEKGDAAHHAIIANRDDAEAEKFLAVMVGSKLTYGLEDTGALTTSPTESTFTWNGESIHLKLPGSFNVLNALAAATFAMYRGVSPTDIKAGLESFTQIPGRMQSIDEGQSFSVIVDYAHTADSLERAYQVYRDVPIIGVLGGTGGGRDVAKRKVMGRIADTYCTQIILTTEDPYDESPKKIAEDVASGITHHPHEYIEDRRLAIRRALELAPAHGAVMITGKGCETHIMGPRGTQTPWSDAQVAREELERLLHSHRE